MMRPLIKWRFFWPLLIGGLLVFWINVQGNSAFVHASAPRGIVSHQIAGDAATVNAIQAGWQAAGVTDKAAVSMWLDLLFITLFTLAGIIGGRIIWQNSASAALRKLALALMLTFSLFGLTDMIETVAQLVQLLSGKGSDLLAGLAKLVWWPKMLSLAAGFSGLPIALIWHWRERSA